MSEKKKPRLCELLGVEVGQKFTIRGYLGDVVDAFWITEGGLFETKPSSYPGTSVALLRAIENPALVVKQPYFTPDEMAVLRLLKKAGIATIFCYSTCRMIEIRKANGNEQRLIVDILPSIKNGERINLNELDLEDEA